MVNFWFYWFFFPAISFLEGAVKTCPAVCPQRSEASTVITSKAWSGRHQRHWPTHTDRLSPVLWTGTLTFVVLKTLINSDQEMWVNSNMQASSSRFPGIPLGSEWSTDPQKGVSIVPTPTPFSVQSLLWPVGPVLFPTWEAGIRLVLAAGRCVLVLGVGMRAWPLGGASPVAQR